MSKTYHNSFFAMNTRFHAVFPNLDYNYADQVFHALKMEVNRIEQKISRFIPESDLSIINKTAFKHPVSLDEELFEILSSCKEYWKLTEGAFDVTLRPFITYWNEKPEPQRSTSQLSNIFNQVGMVHLHLNKSNRTISFDNKHIEIDLGGFGKGYALERVDSLLNTHNIKSAFISFGESSILTLGRHPAGDCWKVGLNNYLEPGSSIHEYPMQNSSMSTSANFYLDDNGTLCNHNHVIDPVKGVPVNDFISLAVFCNSSIIAEILSTALLVSSDSVIRNTMEKIEELNVVKIDYSSDEARVIKF